jgi:hypothetical protein
MNLFLLMFLLSYVNLAIEIEQKIEIPAFFPYLLFSLDGSYYLYIESNTNSKDC